MLVQSIFNADAYLSPSSTATRPSESFKSFERFRNSLQLEERLRNTNTEFKEELVQPKTTNCISRNAMTSLEERQQALGRRIKKERGVTEMKATGRHQESWWAGYLILPL
jgi:hypothetical protein